jgi:hypothetical protein
VENALWGDYLKHIAVAAFISLNMESFSLADSSNRDFKDRVRILKFSNTYSSSIGVSLQCLITRPSKFDACAIRANPLTVELFPEESETRSGEIISLNRQKTVSSL